MYRPLDPQAVRQLQRSLLRKLDSWTLVTFNPQHHRPTRGR